MRAFLKSMFVSSTPPVDPEPDTALAGDGVVPVIVHVEDDDADALLIETEFRKANPRAEYDWLRFVSAEDCDEWWRSLPTSRRVVDLVIIDHGLPGMSGGEFETLVRSSAAWRAECGLSPFTQRITGSDAKDAAAIKKDYDRDTMARMLRRTYQHAVEHARLYTRLTKRVSAA